MKYIIYLFVFLFPFIEGNTQNIKLLDSIPTSKKYQRFVGIDTHEYSFFTNQEEIYKTNHSQEWIYTNYELGIPTSISILNPLQILVFYKEANTVVFLDRFLNETQRIEFNILNPPKIAWWVENAKNQEVWVYNGASNQLEFFDYKNNRVNSETIPFFKEPKAFVSDFNSAYVLLEDKICKYNNYGTQVICSSDIEKNIEKIHLSKSYLTFLLGSQNFKFLDTNLEAQGKFKVLENNIVDFSVSEKKLYIFNGTKLKVYQLNFPSN